MTEKVRIPIAIFEHRADFKRPVFDLWLNRARTEDIGGHAPTSSRHDSQAR